MKIRETLGFQAMLMVGVERFELPTLWSQTRCATRLRYTPFQQWERNTRFTPEPQQQKTAL